MSFYLSLLKQELFVPCADAASSDVADSEQGSAKPTPTSSPQKEQPINKPAESIKGFAPLNSRKPADSKLTQLAGQHAVEC